MDFLIWVRGPGFVIAVAIFLFGMALRLIEIYGLGRKPDFSEPRPGNHAVSGLRTVFSRSVHFQQLNGRTMVTYIGGYVFHIGLFVTIFLFIPHIEIFDRVLGVSWPGLPNSLVDLTAVITLIALLVILIDRFINPVKRLLTRFGDYLAWALTVLPLLSGYMTYHHLLLPYEQMLALHILSAELLLALMPFTKLTHAVTLFTARWYNGAMASRKGVAS